MSDSPPSTAVTTWSEETAAKIVLGASAIFLFWMLCAVAYSSVKLYKLATVDPKSDVDNYWFGSTYISPSGLSALLALVIGFMSATSIWPQPQTSLAVLTVLQSQTSSIGFCDTEPDGLIDKTMDVLAVVATALTQLKISKAYSTWETSHNPKTYMILALVMEGACAVIWVVWWIARIVFNQRNRVARSARDMLLTLVIGTITVITIVYASKAFHDSYKFDESDYSSYSPTVFADALSLALPTLFLGVVLQSILVSVGQYNVIWGRWPENT